MPPNSHATDETHLSETAFWDLIERSRRESGGQPDKQAAQLESALAGLSEAQIEAFAEVFGDLQDKCDGQDMWKTAAALNGPVSDDGFEYFQAWLIGQGRQTFEAAVQDPNVLTGRLKPPAGTLCEFEDLLYAPMNAYFNKTGKDWYDR
jgi:hypothetical protein